MALAEREKSLSYLSKLYTECRQGQGRVAVLTGAIGTGKTELLHNFADEAIASGAIYCSATASRVERTLPLGVISQLFRSVNLPAETREQAARLLQDGVTAARVKLIAPEVTSQVPLDILHGLGVLLLDVAENAGRPLLIAVDDAHHADLASMQCISSVIGQLRRARVMVLISTAVGPEPFNPTFLADLPAEPYGHRIRLELLSETGVRAMIAQHLDRRTAEHVSAECYSISGGNPALVRGLVDDYHPAADGCGPPQMTVGTWVSQAMLNILHRCDSSMLNLTRALAVLDESVSATIAGRLVGLGSVSTSRALTALNDTGALVRARFRHPGLRAAVLDGLAPEEQAALHARAAGLLHADGAHAPVIARQLLAAEGAEGTWVAPVLSDAAEQALRNGEVTQALDYLRLAHRVSATEPQRSMTQAALARAEWRVNPALAMRHTTDLITAIQSGYLTGHHAFALVSRLMWFGRAAEARAALHHIGQLSETLDQASVSELATRRAWFSSLFPTTGNLALTAVPSDGFRPTSITVNSMGQPVSLLVSALTRSTDESLIAAEHILQENNLEETTIVPLISALGTFLVSDQVGAADMWCDSLQKDAIAQGALTWRAVFTAIRSVAAFRQGDLASAETYARSALTLIPTESWGIWIGIPLGIIVQVMTVTGKYQEALGHLRTTVQDAMFETPPGLFYLQARGRFHFARHDFRTALHDFQSIADLTASGQIDMPALVPWRTDVALTYLRLGHDQAAHELVTEQLKRIAPGQARERGIALRVLAACSAPPKRLGPLIRAVRELQSCGDRLELSYALADLSDAYHELGEMTNARTTRRRAHQIARQCGVATVIGGLPPDEDRGPRAGGDASENPVRIDLGSGLSKAERRVAALAADGYSNRQIASKLFVTVSTVEQHLTRVYSKLKVSHRSDLPFYNIADSA